LTPAGGQQTDPRSRIVFIVRNIPRESIEALFGPWARSAPAHPAVEKTPL